MKRLRVAAATAGVFSMLAIDGANAGVRYYFETLTPDTISGALLSGVIEFDPEFWGLGQHFHGEVSNIDFAVAPYFGVERADIGAGGCSWRQGPAKRS